MNLFLQIVVVLGGMTTIFGFIFAFIKLINLVKSRYKFDLNFKQILFAKFSFEQNQNLNNRICLLVYDLKILNQSDDSQTLKSIDLSYRYNHSNYVIDSYVVSTGKVSNSNNPALVLFNGKANIILMNWNNIRPQLGELIPINHHSVFSGSAVFIFDSVIIDPHLIKNLKLRVTDYHGRKVVFPITFQEEFVKGFNDGFSVLNHSFNISDDNKFCLD
jgi:hypothetical protein